MKINLSNWKINTSVEEKLMFFLRKRKTSTGNKTTPDRKDDPNEPRMQIESFGSEIKKKQTQKADVAASEKEGPVKVEDTVQASETETPVKVIIPASALKEELTDEVILQQETGKTLPPIPEEVADSLLVKAKPQDLISEPAARSTKGEAKDSLFSDLFGQVEQEEDTPLDRLIKSLPDISMEEILNQAEETQRLMNEWYGKQGR